MKRTFNSATSITEKTAVGLFRWAATDHINKGRPIQFIPGTTFLGTLWNIIMELFFSIFTAVLTGAIAYVMIAYPVPSASRPSAGANWLLPSARSLHHRAIRNLDLMRFNYLPYAKVHKRSWVRDVQLFARIQKAFGHLKLDQIEKRKVSVWHASLLDESLSHATADHHPKLMRRIFSMAQEDGIIEKNPLARFALFNHDNNIEHYLIESG